MNACISSREQSFVAAKNTLAGSAAYAKKRVQSRGLFSCGDGFPINNIQAARFENASSSLALSSTYDLTTPTEMNRLGKSLALQPEPMKRYKYNVKRWLPKIVHRYPFAQGLRPLISSGVPSSLVVKLAISTILNPCVKRILLLTLLASSFIRDSVS